jgi:two-component system NtrC family sensor kinase/two-component system sensor histidine kinase AtoS
MNFPENNQELIKNLEHLIKQTYQVENEFKELKSILDGVIEFLPQALWVLDEEDTIIVQNSKAKEIPQILDFVDDEVEINDKVFLIQKSSFENKIIVVATDITVQKRNERLISMGQMAAHLAHEIRNPIGSVSILLSMLTKKCSATNIIEEIKKSIFRVERIIKSTLLFSKGLTLNKKTFYVSDMESELKKAIEYYTYSKDIDIVMFLPHISIKADFDLLILTLQNLIFNAIDSIEDSEKDEELIEVLYQKDENYHYFNIYDSGDDFEDKNILFETFKSTKTKGNGLGLSLSKQIVEAHKGEIYLSNVKKGFTIKLPIFLYN